MNVEERILLFQILPHQHTFQVIKEVTDLRDQIKFSEEETRKFDIYSSFPSEIKCEQCDIVFVNESGVVPSAIDGRYTCPKCGSTEHTEVIKEDRGRSQITYNKEVAVDYVKDIKPKVHVKAAIVEIFEEMSKSRKMTEQYITLYEKFV